MRTIIFTIDWAKLQIRDPKALMPRLAICVNDLVQADRILRNARKRRKGFAEEDRTATLVYSMRLSLSHFHEGLILLQGISTDQRLKPFIQSLSADNLKLFKELSQLFKGESSHGKYRQLVERLRNQVGFHYDETAAKRGVRALADGSAGGPSRITVSEDPFRDRFTFADTLLVTTLCDPVWKAVGSTFTESERQIDAAIKWTADHDRNFVSVARELCLSFLKECRGI
jgi:hypothetical protein